MSKPGARGDFGAGHAFDETEDQRLAVSFGEGADGLERGPGFGVRRLRRDEFAGGSGLFGGSFGVERKVRFGVAMKIRGAVAGDGGEPAGEVGGIAEGGEFRKCPEEDVLDEVFNVMRRDASEQDTVNHAGVTGVEVAVGGAVSFLRGAHEGGVGSRGIEWWIHGSDACWSGGEFIESSHVNPMEKEQSPG